MFGEKLSYLRRIKNITQDELGNILGFSKNAISSWESGRTEPDLKTINKIANYFQVSIDYLIGEEEKEDVEKLRSALKEIGLLNKNNNDMTIEDFEKAIKIVNMLKGTNE